MEQEEIVVERLTKEEEVVVDPATMNIAKWKLKNLHFICNVWISLENIWLRLEFESNILI